MNTKWLMTASAIVAALGGIALSFALDETLRYFGGARNPAVTLILQIAGAAFLGFAILDWMARHKQIGGIYNRPLGLGNLLHFLAGAIAIIKYAIAGHRDPALLAIGAVYALLAIAFGVLMF